MTILVKHSKVSTIPDDTDTSLVRPSDWNADHTLTGTIDVTNGGTGASTLTGYVKGNGTSAMTAVATVPSTDITGLGTMSTQNANAVTITGGTINGTTIGATTATTGAFTTLTSTGGAVNGTIGATTPAAGTFTTITGQTEVLKGTGTNLFLQSNTFTTTWTQTAVTPATTVATTDPFGGTNAYTLTEDSSTNPHRIFQPVTTVNQSYVISCYFKANTRNWALLRTTNSAGTALNAYFNVSTGVLGTVDSGLTGTITSVGNGWYRCSIVLANAFSGVNNTTVGMSSADNTLSYTGNGTSSIYIYGSQFEVGSLISPYTATTTSQVYGTPTLSFSGVAGLGLESNGALYVSPAGTGALQAQATTSSTVGGNARGANAVDWQTSRANAAYVASGSQSTVSGGASNRATSTYGTVSGGNNNNSSGFGAVIAGGNTNTSSNSYAFVGAGESNTASNYTSAVVAGASNTSAGLFNFVGGGFTNSGTSGSAVTTQSGTMNATTAVTLSGSNANIKVGQYISGTSIAGDTYVAAISGTALTLSKNASGSSTSTLSFFTPHGVVVGGGNNQATGSYSFIGGGGDAGTAANRNTASGDWSVVSGGFKNVASGLYSTVVGGYGNTANQTGAFVGGGGYAFGGSGVNTASGQSAGVVAGIVNTASGNASFVGAGYSNTANSQYGAVMGGSFGTTRSILGNHVFSACQNPISQSSGINQAALLILARQTTDATATVLCSDSSAASGTNQVILPNNSAYYFTGEVISGVTGGGNTKGWEIAGVIKRGANAGATTLVGSTVTSLYADAGAATWTIGLTADTTNGGLAVTFTGQASTTIRTVCQIRTTEMTY